MLDEYTIITESEYDSLDEGAKRAYRRVDNKITQYFRCTSGPKKGKLASDPSKCGQRKDPKRVRHGRRVAQQKGAIRVRKTMNRKKTQSSKRVSQLNRTLNNRRANNNKSKTNESFLGYLVHQHLIEKLLENDTFNEFLYESSDSAFEMMLNSTLLDEFLDNNV